MTLGCYEVVPPAPRAGPHHPAPRAGPHHPAAWAPRCADVPAQDVKTYSEPDGRARDEFEMADDLVMLVHHTQAGGVLLAVQHGVPAQADRQAGRQLGRQAGRQATLRLHLPDSTSVAMCQVMNYRTGPMECFELF